MIISITFKSKCKKDNGVDWRVAMINNNLSTIMGKKRTNISAVAKATGISRTTLTSLYYDRSNGITFSVLDKLCSYFDCTPGDIFEVTKGVQHEQNG